MRLFSLYRSKFLIVFRSPPTGTGVTAASTTPTDFDVRKYSPYQFEIDCNTQADSLEDCIDETPVTCASDAYVFLTCEGGWF